MTGANQQNEGYGYILYLNSDKTVKTYTRINNTDGGFGLTLTAEDRFSRSISFIGDLRADGTIAVNYGGGAGARSAGALYLLFFKPCEFIEQAGKNHWSGGITLFSNWKHSTQTVTDSFTFEQCTFKAFETDATYMTYNFDDGRCICKDSTANLATSTENSNAYVNQCHSAFETAGLFDLDIENPLSIYPNPTYATFTIETSQTSFSKSDIYIYQIYSILGKELNKAEINSSRTNVNLSNYPRGTYIIVTNIGEVRHTTKLVRK
jgi:hypothetical protein